MFDFNKASIYYAPEDLIGHIEYMARVSNPSGQLAPKLAKGKLLNSLVNRKHWSPLEMMNVVMYVETPRDIGRQLLRHKFRVQEFSQRYQEVNTNSFVYREARGQHPTDIQSSLDNIDERIKMQWDLVQADVQLKTKTAYDWAIAQGIAKEQARAVLPEGMTMSRLFVNGDVRTWLHYCQLRNGNGTQLEHQDLSKKCTAALAEIMPDLFGDLKGIDH